MGPGLFRLGVGFGGGYSGWRLVGVVVVPLAGNVLGDLEGCLGVIGPMPALQPAVTGVLI